MKYKYLTIISLLLVSVITLSADTVKPISISSKFCKLTLNPDNGEIISLTPGTKSLQGPWFEIVEEKREGIPSWKTFEFGEKSIFRSGPVTHKIVENDKYSKVILTWTRPNGLIVTGEIMLAPDDKGPLFRITVKNTTGDFLVDKIRFILKGIQLGNPDDDWFSYPHTLGAAFRVNGFKPNEQFEDPYPALMFMQWLDCYDENQGVYIGAYDDYGYNKSLVIGKDADGIPMMGINFGGCWIADKNDSWTTPWVQIASHKGDWRAGADLYREFSESAFKADIKVPDIIKEMPTAQVWLSYHASNGNTGKLFEIQQQSPIHSSYIMKSLNTSYPEGWDGFQGSALEYHDAFNMIRKLGGSPALFTFDRAPLLGRPNYADYVSKWARCRRDGTFDEGFTDMLAAPMDKDFIRARIGEAVRWVREFNIDEIHYDTEATCGDTGEVGVGMFAGPAYNNPFGIRPNEVPHYFKELYNMTLDACREYNPIFSIRGEDCADFFFPSILTSTAHYFTTSQIVSARNHPNDAKMIPMLLRYTLPKYTSYLMPSMSSNDFWTYGFGMGYGFHGGGPSWCLNDTARENEEPSGELRPRYGFYDLQWRQYYDFRVGFEEAVVDAEKSVNNATAFINGKWINCAFPNPVIAVTHTGGGREVTLGQWFHNSQTAYFGNIYITGERMKPVPIKIRIPTLIKNPSVRLYGRNSEISCNPKISNGIIELDIQDPTCFAVEAFEGPSIKLELPQLAAPGKTAAMKITVNQPSPKQGKLIIKLPAGWKEIPAIKIPAEKKFTKTITIQIPSGIFGRNYPIKATFQTGSFKRTAASHLKVMEPLSVTYSFDVLKDGQRQKLNCIEPGKRCRITVTCINNTENNANLAISIRSPYLSDIAHETIPGIKPIDIGDPDGKLNNWFEKGGAIPENVLQKSFDFDCHGLSAQPFNISVTMNNKMEFSDRVFPRLKLMDINGEWKVKYKDTSKANTGGVMGRDIIDFELTTPEVWDGNWERINTPFTLPESKWGEYEWAIYRRMVFIPKEWQGNDIQLRLQSMGGLRWGPDGALNIVYINGYPAGRIGIRGDRALSPFLKYGAWNLFCIISSSPQRLVNPYLFVRESIDPANTRPHDDIAPPDGAFVQLSSIISGQGVMPSFIMGFPEKDYRRTNLKSTVLDQKFIYFAIADQFIKEPKQPVDIEIEYLDDGFGPIGLDYDSTSEDTEHIFGAFKPAPQFNRTNTGEWKKHTWTLTDARFANRQHLGTDFRVYGEETELKIRSLAVKLSE